MTDKYQAKLDKKKKKAEYKLDKKRAKEGEREKVADTGPRTRDTGHRTSDPGKTTIQVILPKEEPKVWYKNPSWIRAIASVVVMIIVILTFYLTYK